MLFNSKTNYLVVTLGIMGLWLLSIGNVMAYPDGISGFSGASGSTCTVCHSAGASVPTVTITGPSTIIPGSVGSYTLTMVGGPASVAGMDVNASGGTLIATAAGTQISSGELTWQNQPFNVSGGSISWNFDWQAPTTTGTNTFSAAVLSGNGNGGTSGDGTGTTTFQITVAAASNQPPVAMISGPTTGEEGVAVTFNGSGSSDPDGSIAAYDWDFGDGSAGSGVTATHAFAVGTYNVTLTVTDDMGATDSASLSIQINPAINQPPVAVISGPTNGTEGVAVTFDGSGSSDPDGSIAAYDWDFGDSTAGTGSSVSHTYVAGTYTVTLTVTDDAGDTASTTLDITIVSVTEPQPPTADTGGPYTANVGEAVQFDGSGSMDPDGSIQTYDWDFGDGNSGTGVGPMHIYSGSGTYTVTLTVTDNDSLTGSSQTTAEIAAINQPPVAMISGPTNGTEGVAVTFDGSGSSDPDGNIVAYDWDLGDSTTGSGTSVTHAYAAGSYTVTLTVTDDAGDSASTTLDITIVPVTEPQPPTADTGGPYTANIGEAVQFDGSGSTDPDGSIQAYGWDFGDGNSGTGASPVHNYSAIGTYTVTLTVTDNDNLTGSSQTTANIVTMVPPPPTSEGKALYDTYCSACHGKENMHGGLDEDVRGASGKDIIEAIEEEREMAFLADVLTGSDIKAIAEYLKGFDDDDHGDGHDRDDHGDGHDRDDDDEGRHDRDDDHENGRNQDDDQESNYRRDRDEDNFGRNRTASGSDSGSGGGGALHWLSIFLLAASAAKRSYQPV